MPCPVSRPTPLPARSSRQNSGPGASPRYATHAPIARTCARDTSDRSAESRRLTVAADIFASSMAEHGPTNCHYLDRLGFQRAHGDECGGHWAFSEPSANSHPRGQKKPRRLGCQRGFSCQVSSVAGFSCRSSPDE